MTEKYVAETTMAKDSSEDTVELAAPTPARLNYTLKLDLRLIPILGCTYTILFLDRTNSGSTIASYNA